MKNISLFKWAMIFMIVPSLLFVQSCTVDEDDEVAPATTNNGKVESNGLSKDINDLVPQEIREEMERLGFPIHPGENPPNIEGAFLAKPFILIGSNRESDNIGSTYSDYYFQFSDQNNDDLTVVFDYLNGPEEGNGLGGFVVGDGSKFTVFAELKVEALGDEATMAMAVAGVMTSDGVDDVHVANFMIDNEGNSSGYWIANGEGRVFNDEDGNAEETSGW